MKKTKRDSGLLKRASTQLRLLAEENSRLRKIVIEERAQSDQKDRVAVLKPWCAHSHIVFVMSRVEADELLEHLTCGMVTIYAFDERRMLVKKITDHDEAVEFFGE